MANEPTRSLPPTPGAANAALAPSSPAEPDEPIARRVADKDTDVPKPCVEMTPTLGVEGPPADTVAQPGRHFGDYELLAEIARGGMGVVYKARQKSLQRIVALKMILANHLASAEQVRRFHVEAEEAGRLDHPNIVPIYQVGEEQGQHYFTMKLFEAGSLDDHMARFQQDRPAAIRLVIAMARAIHYAHLHGVLHRDLKPGNILLDADDQPHVTDFGLAKHLGEATQHTQSGVVMGTPSYMAPEQAAARKDLSIAVDVYSLGAMLFELLTGRPPFKGDNTMSTILQVLEKEPPRPRSLNPHIDRDLETITLKCLEKIPQRRYASALHLADDLERYLSGKPIRARPASMMERTVKWVRRRPATAALVGVAAVAVLIVVGLGISDNIRLQAAYRETDRQRQDAVGQRQVAEERRKQAEEHQRLADEQRLEAEQQRKRAEANANEARRQEELVQAHLKKRMEIIDDFLFRVDGRIEKLENLPRINISSLRQEFLHDALQLSASVLKDQPKDANARRQMARLYSASGALWRRMRNFGEANAALGKAIGIQRQLASDFADKAEYRNELALTLAQRGRLLRDFRRFPDARLAYDEAIRLDDELAHQHPKDSVYRQRGALDRFRRADLLEEMGQKKPAEEGYRDALGRQTNLIAAQPGEPAFREELADTAASLSALLAQKKTDAGLSYLEQSLQARRHALRLAPHLQQYGSDLRTAYNDLSDLLAKCGRHAELAKMAEAYRKDFPDDNGETYNAACFMAGACRAAHDSKQLAEAERKQLSELYGARAVKLLDMAIHEGWRDRSHMDWDTDLDPLRKRKDYLDLIAALDRRFPTPQTPKQELDVLKEQYGSAYGAYTSRLRNAQTVAEKNKARAKAPRFAEFAERFFQMADKHRGNGTAVEALSWLLEQTAPQATVWAAIRRRALEALKRDHLQKPEMAQLCQTLSESPASDCDELLRAVLAKHAQDDVRGLAAYALAQSLLQQAETAQQNGSSQAANLFQAAEKQLNEVIKAYGSVPSGTSSLGEVAKDKLYALRHLSIGRQAREIEGRDLDGKTMKLSDYRGKVVVLDFWADWCGYCRQMYPQERTLVARMKDRPFALLGINCDDDLAQAKRAVQKDKLDWRSWQDRGRGGERITTQWQVSAFPTIYVLDAKGVIRYKDVRGKALDKAVAELLQEMAQK